MDRDRVLVEDNGSSQSFPMASPEAFSAISKAYLRCGWDNKYVYSFTWMGRPVIQLPDDMFRIQEVIYKVKPDVVLDIGVAHGGSLVFFASLCKAMEKGRVIGVDIDIRAHNRVAIESHMLTPLITLIEGDSISPSTVVKVRENIKAGERVLVLLDGCHTRAHVRAELEAYSPLVAIGSYIVAMDGIMKDLVGAPRSSPDWATNNPSTAALEFVRDHPAYVIEEPEIPFNEGTIKEKVTYWPNGFIKRMS
jgi:cephalosporin hydroxylase